VTTLYTTLLATISYTTAGVSHPVPLSGTNRFPRLKLSVCNPSYHQRFLELTLTVEI